MPRPVWKGHISFGLVNVPITLYSAEQKTGLKFNLLDSRDQARVRYERVNEVTGEEVPWNQIVKGYEYEDGNYVLLEDEDFQQAAVEATQTVEIEGFVDEAEISSLYYEKPYYLVPQGKGEKGYVLLRETLRSMKKVGIARVVIRTRQYMAALLVHGDALVLNLLRFTQELRDPGNFDLPTGSLKDYNVSARELDMAEKLIRAMGMEWEPDQFHDEYREALLDWIQKKVRTGETTAPAEEEAPPETTEPVDIMELLRASVEQRE